MRMNEHHKKSGTPIYNCWSHMKSRCHNTSDRDYMNYGERGIKVCSKWRNSFKSFYKDMGDMPKGMSLERINNSKGYYKENCKWANSYEQSLNKRKNWNQKGRWFVGVPPNQPYSILGNNQTDFSKKWYVTRQGISKCLRNKIKTHFGWTFYYT